MQWGVVCFSTFFNMNMKKMHLTSETCIKLKEDGCPSSKGRQTRKQQLKDRIDICYSNSFGVKTQNNTKSSKTDMSKC